MKLATTLPLAAMVIAGCGAAGVQRSNPPVSNVAAAPAVADRPPGREYRTTHPVMVVCDSNADGWCEQQVDDRLTIHDARDGAITVSIELIQTNAHMCSFEGELKPAPSANANTRRWTFHGVDDDGPCDLALERTSTEIKIQSEGCRYYCGARASLEALFAVK